MRSAVLDLGSNSFHVLVADVDGHSVVPVLREREMLHLGRAVARHGEVPAPSREQAVQVVAHLSELARRSGAGDLLAVATSALRDARGGDEVIAALSAAAGVEIRVLGGVEEARLAYLGVRAAVAVVDEPVLVLDLGGGSLELAVGTGGEVAWSASVPLGASRLSADIEHDPPKRREIQALRARVDAELDPLLDRVTALAPAAVIAVGGTVRALARVVAADEARWLPATLNQFHVDVDQLERIRDRLTSVDTITRGRLPGMKSHRADHLHVAAVLLTRTLERLGVDRIVVSDWGLREGLLLDTHAISTPPSALQLRSDQVARLRRTFSGDDPHPSHVAHLAALLFERTQALHGLDATDRELLRHAAELHSIGEALALRRQHLHGAYLVENAELRGFDPEEAAMLATLVRFHRSRGIAAAHPPYAGLSAQQRRRTEGLLALLQVADGLDRAHDQAVTGVEVQRRGDVVELLLSGGGLHVTRDELERKTRLFARMFDVDVQVRDLAAR